MIDDGVATIKRISGRYDANGVYIHGNEADRTTQSVLYFPTPRFPSRSSASFGELEAKQARYIPLSDTKSPSNGGWLLRGASLQAPLWLRTRNSRSTSHPRPVAERQGVPRASGDIQELGGETYFLRTPFSFAWPSPGPGSGRSIRHDARPGARSGTIMRWDAPRRWTSPSSSITGCCGPLVKPGLAVLEPSTSARRLRPEHVRGVGHLAGNGGGLLRGELRLSVSRSPRDHFPEFAAWGPLIIFGTIAAARWDAIRT